MVASFGSNGTQVSRTSVYRLRVRTDSADENALLLLADNELVAILVELADEGHGDERGNWMIEKTFGLGHARVPEIFSSASDAAGWVAENISNLPFLLGEHVRELS